MTAHVANLWRWPVKGFGGEELATVSVAPGELFPFDRAFAIENGPSGFAPDAPVHIAKRHFVCMVHQPQTGRLSARYDETTARLLVDTLDGRALIVDPDIPHDLEALTAELVNHGVRGPLRLCSAEDRTGGHGFTDVPDRWISIQNQATLDAVSEASGSTFDPRRLRANVLIAGWDAWSEEELVGKILKLGDVQVEVAEVINRCRAIDVNPETAEMDRESLRTIMGLRGARSIGLYARIMDTGTIRPGDAVHLA
ncbi:MAG: MOSC domain-containing protein [Pseudomonadota bacterium]